MHMNWMNELLRAPADEGTPGTGEGEGEGEDATALIGDDGDTGEGGDADDTKALIGDDDGGEGEGDDKANAFEAPVDAEAFVKSLGDDYKIEDQESFNKFIEMINTAGSREELAKNLISAYTEAMEVSAKAAVDQFQKTQKDWQAETRADPDYGGEKLTESLTAAKAVAQEYGGKEFLKLLSLTGAGNNIHMVRFLNEVKAALPKEAVPVDGKTETSAPKSQADRLFGATKE